jgi:hypothetical protein
MSSLPLPGGRSPLLLIGVIILLIVCVLPLMLVFGGGDSGDAGAGQPLVREPTRRPPSGPIVLDEQLTKPVWRVGVVIDGAQGHIDRRFQ